MDMVNKFRWWIIQLHRLEQHNVRFLQKKMEVNYFLELGSYHFLVQERLHGQIKQKSGVDHIRFIEYVRLLISSTSSIESKKLQLSFGG
jgi:hypothetical protein